MNPLTNLLVASVELTDSVRTVSYLDPFYLIKLCLLLSTNYVAYSRRGNDVQSVVDDSLVLKKVRDQTFWMQDFPQMGPFDPQ
jgi:hypothetical protein